MKGVAHKTQGASYGGARAAYVQRSLGPHFTIGEDGRLYQHVDTKEASSAMANRSGGVQTNRDGAVQVEIVGFSGQTAGHAQLVTFVELQHWLFAQHDIPLTWPAGRPPKDANSGYGLNSGHRSATLWDTTAGWYGHSQVPENTHWDPAWTDQEWAFINQGEDVMNAEQEAKLNQVVTDVRYVGDMVDSMLRGNYKKPSNPGDLAWLDAKLAPIKAKLDSIQTGNVDIDALAKKVADLLAQRLAQ